MSISVHRQPSYTDKVEKNWGFCFLSDYHFFQFSRCRFKRFPSYTCVRKLYCMTNVHDFFTTKFAVGCGLNLAVCYKRLKNGNGKVNDQIFQSRLHYAFPYSPNICTTFNRPEYSQPFFKKQKLYPQIMTLCVKEINTVQS